MGGRRGIWLAAGVAAALACGGLAPATAGAKKTLDSFEGSCSLGGPVTFTPPLTSNQQALSFIALLSGTCDGTLNGKQLSNAPVKANTGGRANASCMESHTDPNDPARGVLKFPNGTSIYYKFGFDFVLTEAEVAFKGAQSGSGHGRASFATTRSPPDLAAQCNPDDGIEEAPMDLSLTTDSPLVSQRRGRRANALRGTRRYSYK